MLVQLLFALMVCCANSQDSTSTVKPTRAPITIEKAFSKKPHYSMFLDLLKSSGLLDQLNAEPNITIFAPTNTALSAVSDADFQALEQDPRRLLELIQFHVTDDVWKAQSKGRNNDKTLDSLEHDLPIRINVYDQLHTIAAEGINITEQNMRIHNGYIHGIDGIMQAPKGDIVEIINNSPDLSTLASLIAASGLDATIRADMNITVFAPTNAALANLGPGVLNYLKHSPEDLQEVLEYHIVPELSLYSIGMRHQMLFETVAGKRRNHEQLMLLEEYDGQPKIFINNAKVTQTDISATNGVLHEIDDLLIPTGILIKMEDLGLGHQVG